MRNDFYRFIVETFVFEKHLRYILTVYPVVIVALSGNMTKNYNSADPSRNGIYIGEPEQALHWHHSSFAVMFLICSVFHDNHIVCCIPQLFYWGWLVHYLPSKCCWSYGGILNILSTEAWIPTRPCHRWKSLKSKKRSSFNLNCSYYWLVYLCNHPTICFFY